MKFSGRRTVQLFCVTVSSCVLLLVMPYFYLVDHLASGTEDGKTVVTVDNRPGNPSDADYTDVGVALKFLRAHTTIRIEEGSNVVDNPIILKHKGVTVIGRGREKTIVRPKNAGKAIFEFDADYLRVENITINAETFDGQGRGTFGVHIGKGRSFSEVLNTKIVNTGASAIIGHSIHDSRLEENIIVNAGDDGIQLRGSRLRVANNIILRYFDEAIDLASGDDIAVINNHTRSGRIGITVNGRKNISIRGNIVEDHILGGFNIIAKEGALVSQNIVRDSVGPAYQLQSPKLVDANRVEGMNDSGFYISDMHNGIIGNNVVLNADVALRIVRSTGNRIYANEYSGKIDQAIVFDEGSSGKNHLEDNRVPPDRSRTLASDQPGNRKSDGLSEPKKINGETAKLVKRLLGDSDRPGPYAFKPPGEIDVKGHTERDMKTGEALAQFLMRQNPGFLSIEVHGNTLRSEITDDLYLTLKGSGALGTGIVRAPVRMLRRVSGTIFPVWHLVRGTEEIAIVTVTLGKGGGAHILFTEGKRSSKRFLILSIARLAHLLTVLIRSFGYEVEDIHMVFRGKF